MLRYIFGLQCVRTICTTRLQNESFKLYVLLRVFVAVG